MGLHFEALCANAMQKEGLGGRAATGPESNWYSLQQTGGGYEMDRLSDTSEGKIVLVNNSRINTSYTKKER